MVLSTGTDQKMCTILKKVSVVNYKGVYNRFGIDQSYGFNRFEIKCNSGHKDIGISLSNDEYNWLVNEMLSQNKHSFYRSARKIIFYYSIDEENFVISTIDNCKVFGVTLNCAEMVKIVERRDMFGYLLRNNNVAGLALKQVIQELYVAVLGKHIRRNLNSICEICKENKGIVHDCNFGQLSTPNKIKTVEYAINAVENEFKDKYNKVMDMLNIATEKSVESLQLYVPEMKKDINNLFYDITEYIDLKHGNSRIFDLIFDVDLN